MNRWKGIWLRAGGVIIVVILYVVLAAAGSGCPIRSLTGIPCAGCGMSRAYLSLLHFDFGQAFYYHPLFWMVPPGVALLLVKKGPFAKPKVRAVLWTAFIAVFFIVYILRLLLWKDSAIYIFHA